MSYNSVLRKCLGEAEFKTSPKIELYGVGVQKVVQLGFSYQQQHISKRSFKRASCTDQGVLIPCHASSRAQRIFITLSHSSPSRQTAEMLKAPPRQTAADTIATLSSRLTSASLLEDKRASILGLRSFAKQYPASVASGSLRDLISALKEHGAGLGQDGGEGDVDTARSILETLLMLFNPDADSPEASEDIALWLADEFSQVRTTCMHMSASRLS